MLNCVHSYTVDLSTSNKYSMVNIRMMVTRMGFVNLRVGAAFVDLTGYTRRRRQQQQQSDLRG